MDTVLSQLRELLEVKDKARLALPGVVLAFLLMIGFLPPRPLDWIPVVLSDSTQRPGGQDFPNPYGDFLGRAFIPVRKEPACTIDAYRLMPVRWLTGTLFETNNAIAQSRQRALEDQNESLDRCLAAERRLAAEEESILAALKSDLKELDATHQAQAARVADYENLHSPLLDSARDQSLHCAFHRCRHYA